PGLWLRVQPALRTIRWTTACGDCRSRVRRFTEPAARASETAALRGPRAPAPGDQLGDDTHRDFLGRHGANRQSDGHPHAAQALGGHARRPPTLRPADPLTAAAAARAIAAPTCPAPNTKTRGAGISRSSTKRPSRVSVAAVRGD